MATTVAVLGAGSWGTALAVHLGRLGHDVRLWARDRSFADEMASRRANAVYLPDVIFPDSVSVTAAIDRAVDGVALVICAVPSHGARAVLRLADQERREPLEQRRALMILVVGVFAHRRARRGRFAAGAGSAA